MEPLERLKQGLSALSVSLPEATCSALWAYAEELLRWNAKVNLTAITRHDEVVEKHLIDSLAVLPEVQGAASLLDLGAGAGLPGVPLALALPTLQVTLVDSVGKKVAFIKNAVVKLGLQGRVKAVNVHAGGSPATEKLEPAQVVIARAFMELGPFLKLAKPYVAPGGRVVAMLGQTPSEAALAQTAEAAAYEVRSRRVFELPFSKDPRGVVVLEPRFT